MNNNFRAKSIIILCFAALNLLYAKSYASQQSDQPSSQSTWIHSDVYETTVDKDGATHNCKITSNGNELLVRIEVRNPVNKKAVIFGKEGKIVINGHTHNFKINKTDGNAVALSWTTFEVSANDEYIVNTAEQGPSAKVMLEPFKEVLRKLPPDIYPLLEKVLKAA